MVNFKPMAAVSSCKQKTRRNFFCLIQKHLRVSYWSLSHFSFPSGIFLSSQQVWTCQTQSWVLLELFWQHQQVVSVQPAKHIESTVKCRGFVCFYSTLQWILKSSGNLAYFACLLGTVKLCCSMWKLLFIPPTSSVCLKKPRYWLRGRGLLINLNLSRHGDSFFFTSSFITEDSSACFSFNIVFAAQPTPFSCFSRNRFPRWQHQQLAALCSLRLGEKSTGFLKPHCLQQQWVDALSSLADASGSHAVTSSLGSWSSWVDPGLGRTGFMRALQQWLCSGKYPSCCCHKVL